MLGILGGLIWASNWGTSWFTGSVTVYFDPAYVVGEVALSSITLDSDDDRLAQATYGISQVTTTEGGGTTENFPWEVMSNIVARDKATSMTFLVEATGSLTEGRWMVQFWS